MDNSNPKGRGNSHANSRRRGGRGKGQRSPNKQGSKTQNTGPKGAIEALLDNTYIIGDARQADKSTKTTEAIMAYIQTNFDRGQDVVRALTALEDVDFSESKPTPPVPTVAATATTIAQYDKMDEQQYMLEYRVWMARKEKYEINMAKAFGVLWGQCTTGVKNKLESRKDWSAIKSSNDAIELLRAIKEVTQDYQDSKYPMLSIQRSIANTVSPKQMENESLVDYTKRFRNQIQLMLSLGGKLTLPAYVIKLPGYDPDLHEELENEAHESLMALCYVLGCNKAPSLMKDLNNAYAR